jgi:hypothetical protein
MTNHIVEFTASEDTKIRIGVPATQPKEAIEALIRLFSEMENVLSARLGLMEILHSEGNSIFTYIIGITCTSKQEVVNQQAIEVLQLAHNGDGPICIVPPTEQYFTDEAIVFFKRESKPQNWFSRLFNNS